MELSKKPEGLIPVHGGYRNMIMYQKAKIIYDGAVNFIKRFVAKYECSGLVSEYYCTYKGDSF